MMGASKRIMELMLAAKSDNIDVSTARFANVAFSDGSLLHGFQQRLIKKQPIVAPSDIRRYFVTKKEAGQLCLFSSILGEKNDIFFPKMTESLRLISFVDVANRFLEKSKFAARLCSDEEDARKLARAGDFSEGWPCLFTQSDTSGEKAFEEFHSETDKLDLNRFQSIGIVKQEVNPDRSKLEEFVSEIDRLKRSLKWNKSDLLSLFQNVLPEFDHRETGKYLDEKM